MNDKEQILISAKKRSIEHCVHFTNVLNLPSILSYGLLSKADLKYNWIDYNYNDDLRLDDLEEAISVSITSPNYKMFYQLRCNNPSKSWVVLVLDSMQILNLDCAFCYTNAANISVSSISLTERKTYSSFKSLFEEQENQATRHEMRLLYFLSIVFIALFIGSDFSGRTLNTYITAGHKRSSIFRVKLIVSQIGCIIILVFPLFVHGIISQFYIGEKLFWNDSTYTMVLLTLFAMITLCALPMFFAFIFRDMGKTLTVSMVLFFVMIFLLNSESAQIISRIIPMGQLRLISLQKVYSTNFCLFVDFLWNFILYFISGSAFLHTDLK